MSDAGASGTEERRHVGPAEPVDPARLVYRWDLDKTYLRTDFDTVRDLLRLVVEPAANKKTVAGASVLLRELKETGPAGIFILSGSPTQLRKVLEAKLRLDGIQWDSFTLKPSLQKLMRGRVGFIRDQVGYKLAALLDSRCNLVAETDEILFGDDAEADAFIYSLYADLCAGRVEQETLLDVLEQAKVHEDDVVRLARLARDVPRRDMCRRAFIHLDRMSSPDAFAELGRRVVPFYNYFQPAAVLVEMGALDAGGALRVAGHLVSEHAFDAEGLLASLLDVARRGHVTELVRTRLLDAREPALATLRGTQLPIITRFLDRLAQAHLGPLTVMDDAPIDYVKLFARDRARAKAAKARAMGKR